MLGIDGKGGLSGSSVPDDRVEGSGGDASVNARFDASQYAFFGNDVTEEVELGGLEDDDDGDNAGLVELDEADYQFSAFGNREEVEGLGSDIDDLASTFSKLDKFVGEPRSTGVIGGRGSFSRESSSAADWAQEPDYSNCQEQHILDADHAQDGKRWWSQPHPSSACLAESKILYRTSSYPQQQQQQHSFSEPLPVPKSSFPSYPPPGGLSQASPTHSHHNNISSPTSGPQIPFSATNIPPFSGSQLQLAGLARGLRCGGNMSQFHPPGLPIHSLQQHHWLNQTGLFTGDHSNMLPHIIQQQLPHSNGLMPPQLLLQQQQHRLHSLQPSLSHISQLQSQLLSQHPLPPQMMSKYEAMQGMVEFREQRLRPTQRWRQNVQLPQQGSDTGSQKNDNGWLQFRSKYMSAEEIESILRMQHAATHSNDPYVEDYYHQACLAKKSVGSRMKHHFCPSSIRDLPSRARANHEPHAYLQVDALGRLPFSSIRRPRPLLEVDPPSASADSILDQKSSMKPLEQEPMLAARITIEDGLCLLLDVEDLDRLLQFSQLQDGGSQLRQRRQVLLEGLAMSLQLVDPLGPGKDGRSVGLAPKDDVVFLCIVSLPKGRKLLSRYLQLLFPGSELTRIVCMAIFRHLRFLFGDLPSDSDVTETTTNLARTVSSCVRDMDLRALSACLTAIVCSPEQPPLRPLGSSARDGASIIIKSVLERATELLTDRNAANNQTMPNRALWQASFDAFFGLLTKYCSSKYDNIMQSLLMQAPNTVTIGLEATRAMSKEMPVDLLRASLPHTDDHQRKMLLDFAQKSMPISGYDAHGNGSAPITSESVPS